MPRPEFQEQLIKPAEFFPISQGIIEKVNNTKIINPDVFNLKMYQKINSNNPSMLDLMDRTFTAEDMTIFSIGSLENGFYTTYAYYEEQGIKNGIPLPEMSSDSVEAFMHDWQENLKNLDVNEPDARHRWIHFLWPKLNEYTDPEQPIIRSSQQELEEDPIPQPFIKSLFNQKSEKDPIAYMIGSLLADFALKSSREIRMLERLTAPSPIK